MAEKDLCARCGERPVKWRFSFRLNWEDVICEVHDEPRPVFRWAIPVCGPCDLALSELQDRAPEFEAFDGDLDGVPDAVLEELRAIDPAALIDESPHSDGHGDAS